MRTQAERDYAYLVTSKRKNLGLVARTLAKATLDSGRLVQGGHRPFYLGQGLYEGCRNVAEYCKENEVGDIVMVDKSARPLWAGISEYWRLAHPTQQRPNIHFINPSLFRREMRSASSPDELVARIQEAGKTTVEQMRESKSPLLESTDKPIMLADACLHSGRAVYMTRLALGAAGFNDVRVGVVKTTLSRNAPYTPDTHGTNNILAAHCFRAEAEDSLVVNNEASIYSAAAADPDVSIRGAEVRRHIRSLISEAFVAEQQNLALSEGL